MRLVDYLDKGASLGPDRPCLTTDGETLTYAVVQELSYRIAAGLVATGVRPGSDIQPRVGGWIGSARWGTRCHCAPRAWH